MKTSLPCNPVAWFEIHVADMQRAKVLYESVFKRSLFALETGALVQHRDRQPTTEGVMVYFFCEDCAVESL
jgi:predicted enzyme related to lactoylglutathione lyase